MKPDYAAQCRFFTAEDACRIALQAYYAANSHITPPPDEPWFDEGGAPYAGATDFAEAFCGELQARVGILALDRLGEFYSAGWSWDVLRLACDVEPEKITPILAKREAEKAAMNDAFLRGEMNDLPSADNPTHNRETEGASGG